MKPPKKPDGKTKDLPEGATSMWVESELECPECEAPLVGSTRRVYCYECGIYWDRENIK